MVKARSENSPEKLLQFFSIRTRESLIPRCGIDRPGSDFPFGASQKEAPCLRLMQSLNDNSCAG